MIVRTYKRRNRGEFLGLLPPHDDQHPSPPPFAPPPDSQPTRTSSETLIFSSSFPSSQDSSGLRDGASLRSSPLSKRGSADDYDGDSLRAFSPPDQLAESPPGLSDTVAAEASILSQRGKAITTAGQKLIKAENLLIKAKKKSVQTEFQSADIHRKEDVSGSMSVDPVSKKNSFRVGRSGKRDFHGQTKAMPLASKKDVLGITAASSKGTNIAGSCAPLTSTLLEAQESGEMMEHMDEINFAMDGLSPGQPLRTRRASLVSILSIFGTRQRRRLLRSHGILKPVLDAVLTVPTDDSSTALAAAAVLFVMACDGQDEDFLDSSACIKFLLKLLRPVKPAVQKEKLSLLGSRLLALSSNSKSLKVEVSSRTVDEEDIVEKVKNLLSTTKGWRDGIVTSSDHIASFPAETLTSECLALLTLEKACLSTIMLEGIDNVGSVRRVGGYFKERLRELGGLDAVCELVTSCFINLKKYENSNVKIHNDDMKNGPRGISVLLRCLKVMENVTFLSENNQKHLLEKIMVKNGETPSTFTAVIIETIDMISDIILSTQKQERMLNGSGGRVPGERKEHNIRGGFEFFELADDLGWSIEEENIKTDKFKRQKTQPAQSVSTSKVENDDVSKEQRDNLLEDCLLSAVKVLMNLTNDNDLGCRQVAAAGGLDAMALLIANHFWSFQTIHLKSSMKQSEGAIEEKTSEENDVSNLDLDLLVVILGVLVNLVEKNSSNRERLASFSIDESRHHINHIKFEDYGIISMLCAIFLSKQGVGHAVESTGSDPTTEFDAENTLKQGQKEAEDMIVEAYSALLLAFLSKESLRVRERIAQQLPRGDLSILVPVLERFVDFHLSLNMLSSQTHELVREVIDSCKIDNA